MSASSPLSASTVPPAPGEIDSATPAQPTPGDLGKVPLSRSIVVLLLALVVGFSYWYNPPLDLQPQAGVIMDLPTFVGDYFGKQGEITDVERRVLPKDTEFARRIYEDGRGHQINCSIVLSGAEQRSIHRPEACLVGQGWTIIGQDNIPIPLASGHKLTARRLTLERQVVVQSGDHVTLRAFYVYWFVGQNVTTASEMERVLLSNWDRVVHNAAHRWAYVSVYSLITENLRPDGLDPDQTQALLVDFTKQIVPTFQISEMTAQAKN
jgi:EpsI family protein